MLVSIKTQLTFLSYLLALNTASRSRLLDHCFGHHSPYVVNILSFIETSGENSFLGLFFFFPSYHDVVCPEYLPNFSLFCQRSGKDSQCHVFAVLPPSSSGTQLKPPQLCLCHLIFVLATAISPRCLNVHKTGGSYSTALAATAGSRAYGDVPEVRRTEGHRSDSVKEMKHSPHEGGKSLKTCWLHLRSPGC